jgi:hypothetical protein
MVFHRQGQGPYRTVHFRIDPVFELNQDGAVAGGFDLGPIFHLSFLHYTGYR